MLDSTRDTAYHGDADLGDFLSRPVKILDSQWSVATADYSATLDPWSSFLENTKVSNKIDGFRNFQGKLHIRIAINGGPFFYGRAIAGYEPRSTEDDHSLGPLHSDFQRHQISMLPHIFLDPTTSEGGELVLPFFCPEDYVDLIGQTYKTMGRLFIVSLNPLQHANSTTGFVGITVYAWMTDVRLCAPTTLTSGAYVEQCGFEPQSGDEYGSGIISKPASVVARVAGMLTNVPAIKPYARPTEMVASAIGRAAHLMGFSRPIILSDLNRTKIKNVGVLANTDQHEAVVKLSLDSKQELTIDPRTVGLSDVDEMSFDFIKQKECFMTSVSWSESDVGGSQLGRISIGPDFHNQATFDDGTMNVLAPMYTLAAPFRHWRGSIKVRFQFVASQLHRGRIRLSYDPYAHAAGSPFENQTYSRIIDLATNRDFEMMVSWNQPLSWLRVLDRLGSGFYNHPGGTVSTSKDHHNGQIRIEVVNELTSPSPALGQPVFINLFVSAGPDFELANPDSYMLRDCEFEPQSGEEAIQDSDNIPESPESITSIGSPDSITDPRTHVYFGENIISLRSLLKRYSYHMSYLNDTDATQITITESNFPIEPGENLLPRHLTGPTATPANRPYNYSGMTLINWFTPCYVGWRGALRSKYITPRADGHLFVRRFALPLNQTFSGVLPYNVDYVDENAFAAASLNAMNGHAGSDIVGSSTDGALEVEFPYYANRRFAPARRFMSGNPVGDYHHKGQNGGHMVVVTSGTGVLKHPVSRFVAAGEDFSLFMWIGQPPVFKRVKPVSTGTLPTRPIY